MRDARRIVLPIFLPWTISLFASMPIEAAEQPSILKTSPATTSAPAVSSETSKDSTSKAPISKSSAMAPATKSQTPPQATQSDATQPTPQSKSPSILQMLEGHETELIFGGAIAVAFFFIGWICGGNYYLRRDRLQRRKIRF